MKQVHFNRDFCRNKALADTTIGTHDVPTRVLCLDIILLAGIYTSFINYFAPIGRQNFEVTKTTTVVTSNITQYVHLH